MIRLWESHEYDVILGVQLFDRCRMTCCPPHPAKSGHVTERDFQEYLSVIHIRLGLRMSADRDTKILVTYRLGQGPSTSPVSPALRPLSCRRYSVSTLRRSKLEAIASFFPPSDGNISRTNERHSDRRYTCYLLPFNTLISLLSMIP